MLLASIQLQFRVGDYNTFGLFGTNIQYRKYNGIKEKKIILFFDAAQNYHLF